MKTLYLKLTLKEPLVISQSNATAGTHQSLEYLPGATLLGALASRFYAEFKKQGIAEQVFHSGKVRFHNAYPLIGEQVARPIPLSLYYDKLGDKDMPINYLQNTFTNGEQGKQLRKGFIVSDNGQSHYWRHQPQRKVQMRTAISQDKGVAQEGQLYGYQMLKAGEQFVAAIDIDDEQYVDTLIQKLKGLDEIFIGRSRTAQYGRVKVELSANTTKDIKAPVLSLNVDNQSSECLVLWLASDMAVSDEYGQPTLSPTLESLGLQTQGRFVAAKSFVRTRQYAPYNGFRRSYDLQRQVLVKGSVLTYQIEGEFVSADLERMKSGLGLYVESGLGQIVLDNHLSLLEQQEAKFKKFERIYHNENILEPQTALISYLKMKAMSASNESQQTDFINDCLDELKALYSESRIYNGVQSGQKIGPSKSQWNAVRQMATDAESQSQLMNRLFDEQQGFIRKGDSLWDVSNGKQTFMLWFKQKVTQQSPDMVRTLAFKVTQSTSLNDFMEGKH